MCPPPLIVTPGDPAGIGPEITLKAASQMPGAFVVMGDIKHLRHICQKLGIDVDIVQWHVGDSLKRDKINIYPVTWPTPPIAGVPEKQNAPTIIGAIEQAVRLCKEGHASAIVTNPIAKSVLYDAGFNHPGHTEFLASLDSPDARPIMMLANDELRVVPLTIHQSVDSVSSSIHKSLIIEIITDIHKALQQDFGIENAHIAVCGLNPHAGENGHMGSEETEIIHPALTQLQSQGITVSGPHPADTLFHLEARDTYDAAVGMYHDQVLIPVKTIDFHGSVNITLNLSFVRTSPDHGTAFDIAGTGHARADSLIAALKMAQNMSDNRQKSDFKTIEIQAK